MWFQRVLLPPIKIRFELRKRQEKPEIKKKIKTKPKQLFFMILNIKYKRSLICMKVNNELRIWVPVGEQWHLPKSWQQLREDHKWRSHRNILSHPPVVKGNRDFLLITLNIQNPARICPCKFPALGSIHVQKKKAYPNLLLSDWINKKRIRN